MKGKGGRRRKRGKDERRKGRKEMVPSSLIM